MATPLHELNAELAAVAAQAAAATVAIGRDGRGSGVVVAEGVVVTNAHSLRARTTQVRFADGRIEQAEVRGSDTDGDLIALTVDTGSVVPLRAAETAPSPGHVVVAAHGDGSVGIGNVAAVDRTFPGPRGRSIANAIEHTAALARGASGGPLVDVDGHLVGINTNRSDVGYQAIAYAGATRTRIDALIAGSSFHRRRLGVALAPASATAAVRRAAGLPEITGLLVRGVADDSPAQRAGLTQGDVIVLAGAVTIDSLDALAHALDTNEETIVLTVVRGVDERTVTVNFAPPAEPSPPSEADPAADSANA